MENIRDYYTRIYICHKNITYKIFILGFLNDGGYFLSDLSNNLEYIATKIKIDGRPGIRMRKIEKDPKNTYSITLRKPKISHHFDGTAHISGEDIVSGYNNDGSAKGLSIKSFHLIGLNDGGPIFGFKIGLDVLKEFPILNETEREKPHLILDIPYIIDFRDERNDKFGYIIEGYYLFKNGTIEGKKIINMDHPFYGKIKLKIIPTPRATPGIIAICCIKHGRLSNGDDTFSINGVPGEIDKNGDREQLSIINKKDNDKTTINSLNYPKP